MAPINKVIAILIMGFGPITTMGNGTDSVLFV